MRRTYIIHILYIPSLHKGPEGRRDAESPAPNAGAKHCVGDVFVTVSHAPRRNGGSLPDEDFVAVAHLRVRIRAEHQHCDPA